jgi:hypothetical protein
LRVSGYSANSNSASTDGAGLDLEKCPAARLELDAEPTWRLCTRGITPERAADRARMDGDQHLAVAALQIVSIIWREPS